MKKNFWSSLKIVALVAILGACKSTPTSPAAGPRQLIPLNYAIIPLGTVIDGGGFCTLSGKFSDEMLTTLDSYTANTLLSYSGWAGVIPVSVDSNVISSYQQNFSTSTPLASHTWDVTGNSSYGIPTIHHTIRSVPSFEITSPSWHSTVSRPLTLTWGSSSDTTSHIIITVSSIPIPGDTNSLNSWPDSTSSTTMVIQPADNGSYTFSSTDLSYIGAGKGARITLIRVVDDISSISGKNYLFMNAYQDNVDCKIN